MPLDILTAGDAGQIAAALADSFETAHGHAPTGVFAAPGRVNLIGEHVDYNGGRCLPVALPHATYAAIAPRDDDTVTVRSLQQEEPWTGHLDALGPGQVSGWASYVAGVVWALQQGLQPPGMDVVVDSRVPTGAGLSSSAALECSVALGVLELGGGTLDDAARERLVEACIRAENEVAGAATGGMDQSIALFGKAGHALLLDTRDGSRSQVAWRPAGVDLLVVDTRATHSLNDGGYESRRRTCEEAARALGVEYLRDVTDPEAALAALDDAVVRRRVRHVLTEMTRVDEAVRQIETGDVKGLGDTFLASHASLRDDYEVSCEELDVVVDTAMEHGALGARMTGGGFGGSAIALVPHEALGDLEEAVARAFADRGWPAPGLLPAEPADGARRLR